MPRLRLLLTATVFFSLAGSTIWLAEEKTGAIGGRLNLPQFLLTTAALAIGTMLLLLAIVPSRSRKPVAFRLAAASLAGLGCLAATEAVLFSLPPRGTMDNPWYSNNPKAELDSFLPWRRPPGLHWVGTSRGDLAILSGDDDPQSREVVFQTDYQGFRNSRDLKQADIVFLGDSFTEAGYLNEDETFVQLVGERLGATVRNLGVVGFTGPTELVVLKEYGLACKPKCVVWQLFEGNDLDEAVMYDDWVSKGRPTDYFTSRDPNAERLKAWRRRSPTHWLFDRFRTPNWDFAGDFTDSSGQQRVVYFLRKYGVGQAPDSHDGWPSLADSLREGAENLRRADVPWVILYLPMKIRVLAGHVRFNEQTRKDIPNWGYPRSSLEDYVRHLGTELEVPVISAAAALEQAAAKGTLPFLQMDTHLSAEGHEIVAKLLVDALAPYFREEPRRGTAATGGEDESEVRYR